MTKAYFVENLDCANCAAKAEGKMQELPEVKALSITFAMLCVLNSVLMLYARSDRRE